ncbi:class I SAM-dependent methyltransferase [Shimia sp. SDUM112013]|uniref:class I SAM-dependent methyltransferase n=1 Tax=Shimia sp. SDUM112013 TaxID=3136160 RepID=UPI0032EF46F1
MSQSRLSLAVHENGLNIPETARMAVFAPRVGFDLSALPRAACHIIQPLKPDYDAFAAAGFDCAVHEDGRYDFALVCLPRAKAQARDLIARAVTCADTVIVDGQKTDGVDSLLKDCRKRAGLTGSLAKSHGKLFWFSGGDFADWRAPDQQEVAGGFLTAAGVFSADGIDPASALLAQHLPQKLGRTVADLGAGWGYLSAQILQHPEVETLYLVEADHVALDCARANLDDPRAAFHWADATTWHARARMDTVVMNPPFHTGRSADPALGAAFIKAAARMMAPAGQLWMVANRHLPYEPILASHFTKTEEIAGDTRFKVLWAARPSRART